MTTSADSSEGENTYIMDAENAAEMARLMKQDRTMTKAMGGGLPDQIQFTQVHDVLDIACGPGGWVLDVAQVYPQMQVVGVDISKLMIRYAGAQARVQKLSNARFRVMDVLKPLDFPDNAFDLVNARLLFGFMLPSAWPKLLQECLRVLRPGGLLCLTEGEAPISNSPACEKLNGMVTRALQLAGQSFSPDGRHTGITPMLRHFLQKAGYQNSKEVAHISNFSVGTEAHASYYENFMVAYKLFQPFLIKAGLTTQEEVDVFYHRALTEMQAEDFCGLLYLLTVSGQKPSE